MPQDQSHSASVGSVACFVAAALTDETSCQSSFWICAHWAGTIANRAWRLVAGIRHKDVRQKWAKRWDASLDWHVNHFHSISLCWWIKVLWAQQSTRRKFQNLSLSVGSQLQPGDKVKDTEGIPSFQRDSEQRDEKMSKLWSAAQIGCYCCNIPSPQQSTSSSLVCSKHAWGWSP